MNDLGVAFAALGIFVIMMIFALFMMAEQSERCREKGGEYVRHVGCVRIERL